MKDPAASAACTFGLVKLRLLVAYLGQADHLGWWGTKFLTPTGLKQLEYAFPRSSLCAATTSTCEASKRFHDERIGRRGVYHLFRLPHVFEERLLQVMRSPGFKELVGIIGSAETAVEELRKMAGSLISAPEGPIQVGTVKHLGTPDAIAELAKHYHSAWTEKKVVLPYLTAGAK